MATSEALELVTDVKVVVRGDVAAADVIAGLKAVPARKLALPRDLAVYTAPGIRIYAMALPWRLQDGPGHCVPTEASGWKASVRVKVTLRGVRFASELLRALEAFLASDLQARHWNKLTLREGTAQREGGSMVLHVLEVVLKADVGDVGGVELAEVPRVCPRSPDSGPQYVPGFVPPPGAITGAEACAILLRVVGRVPSGLWPRVLAPHCVELRGADLGLLSGAGWTVASGSALTVDEACYGALVAAPSQGPLHTLVLSVAASYATLEGFVAAHIELQDMRTLYYKAAEAIERGRDPAIHWRAGVLSCLPHLTLAPAPLTWAYRWRLCRWGYDGTASVSVQCAGLDEGNWATQSVVTLFPCEPFLLPRLPSPYGLVTLGSTRAEEDRPALVVVGLPALGPGVVSAFTDVIPKDGVLRGWELPLSLLQLARSEFMPLVREWSPPLGAWLDAQAPRLPAEAPVTMATKAAKPPTRV